MKLSIRKIWNGWEIKEDSGTVAGWIRRSSGPMEGMDILDPAAGLAYRVEKQGVQFRILEGSQPAGSGRLFYETDEEGNVIQKTMIRPPMAVRLEAELSGRSYALVQKPDRSLMIFQGEEQIGTMEHILSLFPHEVVSSREVPWLHLAVLDVLGYYMVHDDDVDIV